MGWQGQLFQSHLVLVAHNLRLSGLSHPTRQTSRKLSLNGRLTRRLLRRTSSIRPLVTEPAWRGKHASVQARVLPAVGGNVFHLVFLAVINLLSCRTIRFD